MKVKVHNGRYRFHNSWLGGFADFDIEHASVDGSYLGDSQENMWRAVTAEVTLPPGCFVEIRAAES